LFIVLSLFILCWLLVGYAVSAPFSRGEGRLFERVALAISAGLLTDYCLMLTGQSIARVLLVGTVVALWGAWKFRREVGKLPVNGTANYRALAFSACCIGYLVGVFYLEIFSEPLLHWDARAIWFFHAKIIWSEGALRLSGGWNHPSLTFSNPDYPKLVPAIAAQLAYMKGFWNEFLPKGSLLVMLIPLIFWIASFCQRRATFLLLLLIYFFSLDAWLSNGYMDGYLALYSGIALLTLGRYLSERRDTDLYSGMCALGICANLKNEGLVFVLCALASLLFVFAGGPASALRGLSNRIRTDSVFVRILLLSIAPTIMWSMWKLDWGLTNNFTADPAAGWSRLSDRVPDVGLLFYLLHYLTARATALWAMAGLFVATVIFSLRQGVNPHRGALVAATTATLYFCGLYIVYLSKPDLNWHLSTSATRTMATVSMGLLVSMYFLLSDLEVKAGETGASLASGRSVAMVGSAT
jgi:hypothetical protein